MAVLTWAGPIVRAFARICARVRGLSKCEPVWSPDLKPDVPQRGWVSSYWNETGLEKEAYLSALLDFFRLRKYPLVLDDGWQPWDAAIHGGPWVRGEIKILVEQHGAEKRQANVGLRLHTTGLARLVVLVFGLSTALAAGSGVPSAALLFGTTMLGMSAWLRLQMQRLSRSFHHGVAIAFEHLPVTSLHEPISVAGQMRERTGLHKPEIRKPEASHDSFE